MEKLGFFVNGKMVYVDFKRTNNKNMYLKVTKDNQLLVTAPARAPQHEVERFVNEHINKFVKYVEKSKANELFSLQEKYVYFNGKKYPLQILTGYSSPSMKVSGASIYALASEGKDEEIEKLIRNFIDSELTKYIEIAQEKFERIMDVPHHEWSVTYKTSNWGTNFVREQRISYSTRLAHYAKKVIDYVIIHELAHYFEHNHSDDFWAIVEKYMPDYKKYKRQLKNDQALKED